MYIVIAGGGIAGSSLAAELVNRKHDVVVVDRDREACEDVYAETGAVAVHGSATDVAVLKQAGIEKADVAIGAMYRDTDNLTFALLARSFGVPRLIVKMRDPAYTEAYRVAGVDAVCNMIEMFRHRVVAEIENPHIRVLTRLEGADAQLVMFAFPENRGSVRIRDLAQLPAFRQNCVFAGILRPGERTIVMPRGDDEVPPGATVFAVVTPGHLGAISAFLGEGTGPGDGA
ncbi:MAG: TrkA family potassium uptake protein [Candidatus Dadabacteria bacterium]|nr:MAG: TrkA family potassium uptake protein [Candidatus Dadabacteria bacterium]